MLLRKKTIFLIIAFLILIVAVFISVRILSSRQDGQRNHEEQLIEIFFNIPISEYTIFLEAKRIEWLGFEFLYAELLVPTEKKDEIFENYLDMERYIENDEIATIPFFIRDKLPEGYAIDYFHEFFGSVQKTTDYGIIVEAQEKHIVFMEEKEGYTLVILLASHPDWEVAV
jgi:hypothetical protein